MGSLWNFLKSILGPVLVLFLLYLLARYGVPAVVTYFASLGTLGWFLNGLLALAILGLIIVFLILIFEKGKIGSGACALVTYTAKPDRCVKVSCASPCLTVTGPYPSFMGSWAASTQDIACFCPPTGGALSGWPPSIQKLFDQATGFKNQSELEREIEKILGEEGIEPGKIDELLKILEKISKGQQLTSEEQEELKKIGKKP
jgi:hypothetical protein